MSLQVEGMVTGTVLAMGNLGLGWYLRGRFTPEPEPCRHDTGKAICQCNHGLQNHDPQQNGKCNVAIEVNHYDGHGTKSGKKWTSCACLRYVGPMPPDNYYQMKEGEEQ